MHIANQPDDVMSSTISIRVSDQTRAALEKLASETHRSKSWLAAAALEGYLSRRQWLEQKIRAADASGVMTDAEVETMFEELLGAG